MAAKKNAKKKTTNNKTTYDHLKDLEQDGKGFEDLNLETSAIPFIKILQDLSPQLKKSKPEYVAEAEAGMIFNNVTEKIYEQPLKFVVGKFERYFIEWKPNRGSFVAAHSPELIRQKANEYDYDDRGRMIHGKTGNHFSDTYVYYVLLPDHLDEGVNIISMSSTQLKEAKRLNRNLTTTMIPGTKNKAMPYYMIWNLETVEMSNDRGEWFGLRIKFDSMVTPIMLENVQETRKELPYKTVNLALLDDDSTRNDKDEQY